MPQLFMIVEVFITQSDTPDSLPQQFRDGELTVLTAMIRETCGKRSKNTEPLFHFPQQQSTAVGRDPATIKCCTNFSPPVTLE